MQLPVALLDALRPLENASGELLGSRQDNLFLNIPSFTILLLLFLGMTELQFLEVLVERRIQEVAGSLRHIFEPAIGSLSLAGYFSRKSAIISVRFSTSIARFLHCRQEKDFRRIAHNLILL